MYTRIKKFEQTLRDTLSVRSQSTDHGNSICVDAEGSSSSKALRKLRYGVLKKSRGNDTAVEGTTANSVLLSRPNTGNGPTVAVLARKNTCNASQSTAANRSLTTPRKREVLLSKISIYIVFMLVICHRLVLLSIYAFYGSVQKCCHFGCMY